MEPTHISRKVDELGRILLPAEIRRTLGLRPGDALELRLDEENRQIILCRPQEPSGSQAVK